MAFVFYCKMADSQRENEPVVINIQDTDDGKYIAADWGFGNSLLVYGSLPQSGPAERLPGRPKGTSRHSSLLHQINWDISLYNEHARKLISESSSIFVGLQKMSSQTNSTNVSNQLVKVSHRYRSIVKALIDNLQTAADSETKEPLRTELEAQSQSFFRIELIWNLCEILFVDVQPSGTLLTQLLDWIRLHFPACETLAKSVTQSSDPGSHPSYWSAVYGYVLQGRISDLRRLLHMHAQSRSEPFLLMDKILRKMPLYSYFTDATSYDFLFQWQQWSDECAQRLKRGEFQEVPALEKACKLLCGDMDTFLEMSELCETWYHLMVSRLLYTDPCVKATDLQCLAHEYVNLFGGLTALHESDNILLAILEFDVLEAIRQSSQYFPDWWFVTHLTDLLHHANEQRERQNGDEMQLREFLLLEYACSLASHPSMWQFMVDYFDHCPTHGRQMLEACLERVPVECDFAAIRVVYLAQERDMHQLAHTVCRVKGQQALRNERLGSALSWALKSKDSSFVTFLADRVLTEYVRRGRFHSLALLDNENLGPSMLVSDRLAFLCKYKEFHQLYRSKNFHQAAVILVSLLTSKLAPKSFWKPLLLDSVPLLESDEVVFNTEQTYELLHCLEEWTFSNDENESEMEKTREQVIRLALARNLARTFTQETLVE